MLVGTNATDGTLDDHTLSRAPRRARHWNVGSSADMTTSNLDGLQFGRTFGPTRWRRPDDDGRRWVAFARRINQLRGSGEVARELADGIVCGFGAAAAAVYLAQGDDAPYSLSASSGGTRFAPSVDPRDPAFSSVLATSVPVPLPPACLSALTTPVLSGTHGIAIRWRGVVLGVAAFGPWQTGGDDRASDVELLSTMAGQAAAVIVAARLSEPMREARCLETLDPFTATLVHDLKNAVSALTLLARNVPGNLADPEFQRDALVTLSRTADRMRRVLATLTSRGVAPSSSRAEPIDLRELIVEATTPLAVAARVRLVRRLRSATTIQGDREALLRVVENLTTNAAEAIDDEGTVTVTLDEEPGYAVISVADTGCGISEDYRRRHLFSPFHTTKKDGWGIGLYQAKQVVEEQDGEILVESVEGRGTTFTVKLPLRANAERPSLENAR